MQIKTIFTDFDGTIVDSLPELYLVYTEFMNKMGFQPNEKEFNDLIGPSLPEVIEKLKEKRGLKLSVSELIEKYMEVLITTYQHKVKLHKGVKPFLKKCRDLGIKIVIVTSAPKVLVETFLTANQMIDQFDDIITPDGNMPGKPNPYLYQQAMKELNIKPDEAVAIEDTKAGVTAANEAGLNTFLLHFGNEILNQDMIGQVNMLENWDEAMDIVLEGR